MQLIPFPPPAAWPALCRRPAADLSRLYPQVRAIFSEVAARGDAALADYTTRFDRVAVARPIVWDGAAIDTAAALVTTAVRRAIAAAARNLRAFHAAAPSGDYTLDTAPGVRCWARRVPLDRVGLYVPGGSAPLFSSLLMLAVPARLAGCAELVVCTPPGPGGALAPTIAAAARAPVEPARAARSAPGEASGAPLPAARVRVTPVATPPGRLSGC